MFLTYVKRIVMKNLDQISIANLITQYFILNFAKITIFQAETPVYVNTSIFLSVEKITESSN